MADQHCPIWTTPADLTQDGLMLLVNSTRAGGTYKLMPDIAFALRETTHIDYFVRSRLTTMLVDLHNRGIQTPEVNADMLEDAKRRRPLPVYERANRLLRHMADRTAMGYIITRFPTSSLAWSESVMEAEQQVIIDYLIRTERLRQDKGYDETRFETYEYFTLTLEGYHHLESLDRVLNQDQAFVSMWLHDTTEDVYKDGIMPAIKNAGYHSFRITQKEHNNKIDDEIIGEILRSRFVVADFTHGNDGDRGSVYFEAGFAQGLGLEVIRLCHKNQKESLAFLTRQYSHILWETPSDLRDQLHKRILAIPSLGQGPVSSTRVS